jgi:hypothetical protein
MKKTAMRKSNGGVGLENDSSMLATAAISSPEMTMQQDMSFADSEKGLDTSRDMMDDSEFDLYNMEIPSEPVPSNDIEDMIRIALVGKVSEKNRLVSNLTEFAFTYTIDNLPSHQSRAPLDQIWYEAGLKFDEIYHALPQDPLWVDRLFKYFSNQTWPKEFTEYIQELKSKKPSQTWLNKCPRVLERPAEEQNITYFGNLLRDRYLTARNFIKWHLAKKWKEPEELPAGWTLNKLLYAIRKSLWPAECRRRFIETVSRKARRQKLSEDETRSMCEQKKDPKRWDPNWYPSQWMTFLFLNRPSKHLSYMFQSSTNLSATGGFDPYSGYSTHAVDDSDDDDLTPMKKETGKKRLSSQMSSSSASKGPMGNNPAQIAINDENEGLTEEESKKRECDLSIKALERKLAILTRQNRPEAEIRQVENELLECLSIQANAYKKYRPNS